VGGALAECEFKPARMRAALSSTMMATDLADYLVRRGATFREAHGAVGRLVRQCEEERLDLHTLPLSSFTAAHPLFGQDVFDALSALQSVEQREVEGGTGPAAVRTQLEAAQKALEI
jgi:argininosuccinate lyase